MRARPPVPARSSLLVRPFGQKGEGSRDREVLLLSAVASSPTKCLPSFAEVCVLPFFFFPQERNS